jgi:hypothetical protein
LVTIGLIVELPVQPAPPRVSDETVVEVVFTPVPTCPFVEIPGGANVTVALMLHVTGGSGGPVFAAATPPVSPMTARALIGRAIAAATAQILRIMWSSPFPPMSPWIVESGDIRRTLTVGQFQASNQPASDTDHEPDCEPTPDRA